MRETLNLLQKLFPIRQCEDSYYKNRSRPCLQYQIGRCLAPCVEGYYSQAEYDNQVNLVRLFLQGKDGQVVEHLVQKMESAAQELDFEAAARFRDQIQSVRAVQENNLCLTSVWMIWILFRSLISTALLAYIFICAPR
ncbi:excinuclease ABC subunit C [Actinobacillus equuli]|nr:excinuclease ABC subunit C [Actinobacillus equuli]